MDTTGPDMIGQRVRAIRLRQQMSIGELAAGSGLSKSFLSRVERGERHFGGMRQMQDVARALGVRVRDLAGDDRPADRMTSALQAVVETVMCLQLGERPDVADLRSIHHLDQQVWRIDRLVEAGDHTGYAPLLPGMLVELHAHAADPDGGVRAEALPLLVRTFREGWRLAEAAIDDQASYLMAERAVAAASQHGDPALIGFAQLLLADALQRAGARTRDRAAVLAMRAADALEAAGVTGDRAEVLGELHETAARADTAAGRYDDARQHYRVMSDVARLTGEGHAFGGWFGPSLVTANNAWFAAEVREPYVLPDGEMPTLPPIQRAHMLVDLARAAAADSTRIRSAPAMLREARMVSAQSVHGNVYVRELVSQLRDEIGSREVRDLATWLGIPA